MSTNFFLVFRELLQQTGQDLHLALQEDVVVSCRLLLGLPGYDLYHELFDQHLSLCFDRHEYRHRQAIYQFLKHFIEDVGSAFVLLGQWKNLVKLKLKNDLR